LGGSTPTPSISGLGGRRRRAAGRVATEMGWRFLPVFAVFVTNVIIAIVAWYAVGALLR
jgi:hypothetical protein